jgi:hypothetical protein
MRVAIEVSSTPGTGSSFRLRLGTTPPAPEPSVGDAGDDEDTVDGQPSMIREYMRQVGVPLQRTGGSP